MDTNIIGSAAASAQDDHGHACRVDHRSSLGLTPETHGNANGIGLADLTTRRLVDSIDYKSTYTTC